MLLKGECFSKYASLVLLKIRNLLNRSSTQTKLWMRKSFCMCISFSYLREEVLVVLVVVVELCPDVDEVVVPIVDVEPVAEDATLNAILVISRS